MSYLPHGNYPSKQIEIRKVEGNKTPTGTSKELLDWVGDDPDRARRVLDQENATDKPRKTLVEPLENLLDDSST